MSVPTPTHSFANFDLRVRRINDGSASSASVSYEALVIDSPAGQASAYFDWADFAAENEAIFNGAFFSGPGDVAVSLSPLAQEAALQEMGHALFATVLNGAVLELWRASQAHSAQAGLGLRLRLRLTDAPELTNWPWESLYDAQRAQFVALSTASPIVRYLEAPGSVAPLTAPEPLRLLIVAAGPRDLPDLALAREIARLQQSLAPLHKAQRVQIDLLQPPTLSALQSALRRNPVHLLHFIGHGAVRAQPEIHDPQVGELAFVAPDGAAEWVSQRRLSTLLGDHPALRLVVLNACDGAQGDVGDVFAGVAQTLIRQRIPAVLAMARPISDTAGLAFAGHFYAAIADGYAVDAALAEARKALYNAGHALEWMTPVLHLRSPDGRLFASPAKEAAPEAAGRPTTESGAATSAPGDAARNRGTVVLDFDNTTIDTSTFTINVGGGSQPGGRESSADDD